MNADDMFWSLAVRSRDNFRCRRCIRVFMPDDHELQAHHIFTRSRASTRHDLENGVSLCDEHHRWAHAEPTEFRAWIRAQIGVDVYDAVQARSRTIAK